MGIFIYLFIFRAFKKRFSISDIFAGLCYDIVCPAVLSDGANDLLIVLFKPQWWSVSRLEGPICTVAGWVETFTRFLKICLFLCCSSLPYFSFILHPLLPLLNTFLSSPSVRFLWPNDREIMRSEGTKDSRAIWVLWKCCIDIDSLIFPAGPH